MRFIVSDTMQLDKAFGKWRYSTDAGVRTWSDGNRLCLYYGYTIDHSLDQLVRGITKEVPEANGKFCVVMLWRNSLQVWVDYFGQSKVYYHTPTRDALTVTNQISLLPLDEDDIDSTAIKRFAKGIYSDEEFKHASASSYHLLRQWQEYSTDHTVLHKVASVPLGHSLTHTLGHTNLAKVHDHMADTRTALSNTLVWDTTRLEDTVHQCMEQHSEVIKKNYNNICSTVSEGVDSILQDMYFDADHRLMYRVKEDPLTLPWKQRVMDQFRDMDRPITLDTMPVDEVGDITQRHATDANLSYLDTVPTLWQLGRMDTKPDLVLYGQNADEMFMHRSRYLQAIGEDTDDYRDTYAAGDSGEPGTIEQLCVPFLYNREIENQTGIETTSLYSDRRIFNLVHRMPREVMIDSMANATPQRNILRHRFGFEFATPRKDQAGYRCKEVLKRLLSRTVNNCIRPHQL